MTSVSVKSFQNHHDHDHDHDWDLSNKLTNDHEIMMDSFIVFDEISKAIATDSLFVNAQLNWGVYDRALYKQCARLGIDRVRATIKEVQVRPGIGNRGGYLLRVLRSLE